MTASVTKCGGTGTNLRRGGNRNQVGDLRADLLKPKRFNSFV